MFELDNCVHTKYIQAYVDMHIQINYAIKSIYLILFK
jgi:hypothetical protein